MSRMGSERRLATALGGLTALLHLLTAADSWGYFRDELYYLANARHLAFGYVDHPPMIAWLTRLSAGLLGESQIAIRVLPALAGGVTVYLACRIAAEMGGGRRAQLLCGLLTALAPVYLSLFGILSMNAYDVALWAAAVLLATRLLRTGDQRLWLLFGLVAGLALETKSSVLFLGFGLVAGLVLTRDWRHFRERWMWLGGALAALVFLPFVVWQAVHDWPMLEFMSYATRFKNLPISPAVFVGTQALNMNPLAAPVALAGLGFYFLTREGRPFRALGWACLVILALQISQRAKPYYFSPAFVLLFAPGCVLFERLVSRPRWRWLAAAYPALVTVSALAVAPLAKPLLGVESFVRYQAALGMEPGTDERKEVGRLPQFFADRLGWRELAETVAGVHRELEPEDRARACVFGQNYGQAGAIDRFGPDLGLPPAISGHNSYWIWGPGECSGEVILMIDGRRESLEEVFEEVELATTYTCADCMPYESRKPIWVCRHLRLPLGELWPQLRSYG